QIGLGVFGARDQSAVGHLDRDAPLQLLVVSEIDDAEAAFSQDSFHPVAADVGRRGLRRDRRVWLPFWFINGLHRIVHTTLLSLAVVTKGSRCKRLYQVRLVFAPLLCCGRHGRNTSGTPSAFEPAAALTARQGRQATRRELTMFASLDAPLRN